MRVLVTSVGGPAGNNVAECFKLANPNFFVVGTDVNKYMLSLSNVDVKALVHHSSEATDMYYTDLLDLVEKHDLEMIYPQSDREIFICALNPHLKKYTFLPKPDTIAVCRDKLKCAEVLGEAGVSVPKSLAYIDGDKVNMKFPVWARARIGAGGWLATKCQNLKQLQHWTKYHWQNKRSTRFMLSEYLTGIDFSWTAIFDKGNIITSALKKRIHWVYRRIGTTAVQVVVHNNEISDICEQAVLTVDPDYTGLVMVDLINDKVTEINAGRIGTTGNQFALMSKRFPIRGHDWYNNFPYLAYKLFMGQQLELPSRNCLPQGVYYLRHLDMGRKIIVEVKNKFLFH